MADLNENITKLNELAGKIVKDLEERKNNENVFDKRTKELNKELQDKISGGTQSDVNTVKEQLKNIERLKGEYEKVNEQIKNELTLEKDINEEELKQERITKKRIELRGLEEKLIKEGLTWDEKRNQLLTKFGEKIGLNTDKIKTGFNDLKSQITGIKDGINSFNKAWGTVDQAASKYVRTIGGSKSSMDALRKSTIDFMETRSIGVKYNTSMEELIKLQGDYNASIGRSIDLTNDQKETFAAMRSVVGEQAAMEFTTKLENFGLNPDEVGDRVGQMFSKAAKSGVAFEKYSKNFLDNIKLAQNYNFKNGLRGLESMAKKATEIKMDMQQVARFADKVSTLEGAVQAGANLSVLGGSFAQYGNPLQMLYEGLNDMEGLQDRMINMFGKLGKWDYSKGQVDVSVFNKQRIKAAAEATGMDYSALMEQINASARRNIVEGKLGSQYNNDQEFKELLLNKAQLDEKGNAYVTINGERKDVNSLTAQDKDYLKAANNSDSDNIAEIAVNTRGFKDITEGFEKQKEVGSAQVNESLRIGQTTKEVLSKIGENSLMMKILGAGGDTLKTINNTLGAFYATYTMLTSIGGGGIGSGKNIGGGNLAPLNSARHFGKTKFGKIVTFGGSKTLLGKRAIKNIAKAGGYGKYVAKGAGIGAAAGAVGTVGDYFIDRSYLGQDKGNHIGGYTATKSLTGAAQGAGIGATIGSIIPGIGTLVGAGIGAAIGAGVGGITANINAKKEAKANILRKKFNARINDSSIYSLNELEQMQFGTNRLDYSLQAKMSQYGDNLGGFKNGGYTGEGNPTEVAGTVHKGEIVIPSTAVKASGNLMNPIKVSSNKQTENTISNNNSSLMKVEPININLTGDLKVGGEKVDPQKVLEAITPQLIDRINDGLVDRRNFRIDRNKTHMKFKTV